jgi:hypothetical protein
VRGALPIDPDALPAEPEAPPVASRIAASSASSFCSASVGCGDDSVAISSFSRVRAIVSFSTNGVSCAMSR